MISDSVSLSGNGTVHVSGTGRVVYPLAAPQSTASLDVGGVLSATTQHANNAVRNIDEPLEKLTAVRTEDDNIVYLPLSCARSRLFNALVTAARQRIHMLILLLPKRGPFPVMR